MTGHTVRVSQTYAATPEAAFDAWINPKSLEQWFGPAGYRARVLTHDLRVGGTWRFQMIGDTGETYHHFGTYLEITPPRTLRFTWACEEQVEGWRDANGDPTMVTVQIIPTPTGVEVTVTHEHLQTDTAYQALTGGWGGGLVILADFLKERSQ